jgi:uncharacterized protein (TIGR02391 family)
MQRIGNVQKAHVERCIRARLHSYQAAFDEIGASPDEDTLKEIWQHVRNIWGEQVMSAGRAVNEFAKTRGVDVDFTEIIRSESAHAHDELLQEWKVWKSRVRLKMPSAKTLKHPRLASSAEYSFHPEIEAVSKDLYDDGHFKSAVLEAFVCVINRVKRDAALESLDGDRLINHAFGPEQEGGPKLRFNDLANQADMDEQRGIMNLFKGIVGIRNFKAHSNKLFNSPERAFEYLALSSLLMRLLDIAQP